MYYRVFNQHGGYANRPERRTLVRDFNNFEDARLFAVRRMNRFAARGFRIDYTGVICDRQDHFLFQVAIESRDGGVR